MNIPIHLFPVGHAFTATLGWLGHWQFLVL